MLTWISDNAKWVIYIFIGGIVAGLLFMDMSQLDTQKVIPVGKVNGEALPNEAFSQRLQQVQAQQQGQNLSDAQNAQMRQELFRSFVQKHLLDKELAAMEVRASVYEMMRDLRDDPPAGIKEAPIFQTDSVFDPRKYEAWLATDSIYDDPQMIDYERGLRTQKVPMKQAQVLVSATAQPSTLEAMWLVKKRETRFDLWVATAPIDSFAEAEGQIDDAAIKTWFDTYPDSFYVERDLVQADLVVIPIEASADDEKNTLDYANILIGQFKDGADFADLARMNSDDAGSAAQGGALGDYSPRGQWVKPFEEAAFALDSGKISEPIRSQFGYHIVLSHGKRMVDTVEQVKVSHILLKITPSPETVDSLSNMLQAVKTMVDEGKELAAVVAESKLEIRSSGWFGKGDEIPGVGYLPGLTSYAFPNENMPQDKEVASGILQNKDFVALAVVGPKLKAGTRSAEPHQERIASAIRKSRRQQAARKHLESGVAQVKALATIDSLTRNSIAKVLLDTAQTSFEGFVPGLGFASPALYSVLSTQKVGEWGPVVESERGAVMVRIVTRNDPEPERVASMAREEVVNAWRFGSMGLFNEWLAMLESNAEVVSNLDMFYRE